MVFLLFDLLILVFVEPVIKKTQKFSTLFKKSFLTLAFNVNYSILYK